MNKFILYNIAFILILTSCGGTKEVAARGDSEPPNNTYIETFHEAVRLKATDRIDEAIETFETLLSYGNHLGLLSEDVDATDGSMWGNFPQAYSHVGLVNAAYRISKKLDTPNFL